MHHRPRALVLCLALLLGLTQAPPLLGRAGPPAPGTTSGTAPAPEPQSAAGLSLLRAFDLNGGYVAAGVAMRNRGFGTLHLEGLPAGAAVEAAYLFWDILANREEPSFRQGRINGAALSATLIGTSRDPCWSQTYNFAYRVDITPVVAGNGSYFLSGFATGRTDGADPWPYSPNPMLEGATLVAVYRHPASPRTRVLIYNGSVETEDLPETLTLAGFEAPDPVGAATTTFFGADGQGAEEPGSAFNGVPLPAVGWDGDDPQDGPRYSDGNLWDTATVDVTAHVAPGSRSATASVEGGPDCLVWVGQVFAVAEDTDTVSGVVSDGHGAPLPGAEAGLLRAGTPGTLATTATGDDGTYRFAGLLEPGQYTVRVLLRDAGGRTRIHQGAGGSLVEVESPPFEVHAGGGNYVENIRFGDPALASPVPAERLADLAALFRHSQQVNAFAAGALDLPGFQPVDRVWGYAPAEGVSYDPDAQAVRVGAGDSGWSDPDRPMNREWHEGFHHLMNTQLGYLPGYLHACPAGDDCADGTCAGGDCNHGGFSNHCTGDSWLEGWAEFWPCALWDQLGLPGDAWQYRMAQGPVSLEYNWRAWDEECALLTACQSVEELAVASLLWDLYDGPAAWDADAVDLGLPGLWAALRQATSGAVAGVRDLYEYLLAAGLHNRDGSAVSAADLDGLFVAHGFFADDGDRLREEGEEAGWGGTPGRRSLFEVPNAYLRVDVRGQGGQPLPGAAAEVRIRFADPHYDFEYTVPLPEAAGNRIGLGLPPAGTDARAEVTVLRTGRRSETYTVDAGAYWAAVRVAQGGYALEHTFTLPNPRIYLPLLGRHRQPAP